MSEPATVLMYSPDTIGLGHIRRNSAIAVEVVRRLPGASVVLLVGSGAGSFFELPKGVDAIKLPSVQKVGRDVWEPRSLKLAGSTTRDLRAGIIRETVEQLRPALLLVDHLPSGVWSELVPTLDLIRARRRSTRVVLGLRDILDEPERVRAKWKADGTYELIRKHYDRVLIYGDPGIFPTAAAYGLEEHMSGRTSYCGYVHARPGGGEAGTMPQPAIEGESKCARGNRRIVVTAGGGHDAFPMMQALIGAVGLLTRRGTALDVVIITGPLMAEARREELRAMAEGLPVAILPWSLEPAHHLDCADLVVTMGGYNSVLETICRARRAIVVPRSGPSAEQSMRAALFAQMGLLTNVLLESATPERLAAEITHALAAPPAERRPLPLGGAARAAELIGRLLTSRKPALERAIPATAPSRYVVF